MDIIAEVKRAEFLDFRDNHKEELQSEFLRNFDSDDAFNDSDEYIDFCLRMFKSRDK